MASDKNRVISSRYLISSDADPSELDDPVSEAIDVSDPTRVQGGARRWLHRSLEPPIDLTTECAHQIRRVR
jgi:hypothetical protein